jgi:FkbM family methyltransferase
MTIPFREGPLRFVRHIIYRDTNIPATLVLYGIAIVGKLLAPVAPYPHIYHRIFWRARKWLGTFLPSPGSWCAVALQQDAVMKVLIDDTYWNGILADAYEYEPEFSYVLRHLDHLDFTFFDCGANFGYWSILLSSNSFSARPTLAIEPAPGTYAALEYNCSLNHKRFTCLRAALSSTTGELVSIDTSHGHSAAHITRGPLSWREPGNLVHTITLDDAAITYFGTIPERSVIKLDVEGEEINAMLGAKDLVGQDVLFFYEDHGADSTCKVTRFVLEYLHMNVYFSSAGSRLIEIPTVGAAADIKKQRSLGYNFFACKRESVFDGVLKELATFEQLGAKRESPCRSPHFRGKLRRRLADDERAARAVYKRRAHLTVRKFHKIVLKRELCERLAIYFHEVLPTGYDRLRELIGHLQTAGYVFVDAAGLCAAGVGRRVFISFDDNFRSWIDLLKVLDECNATTTFFVNTFPFSDVADRSSISCYFDRIKHHGERMSLSTTELRELAAAGHRIGCHSHSHFDLTTLDRSSLGCEIDGSKATLEKIIGHEVVDFAYPFGMRRHFSEILRNYCLDRGFQTISNSIPGLQFGPHRPTSINRTVWIT